MRCHSPRFYNSNARRRCCEVCIIKLSLWRKNHCLVCPWWGSWLLVLQNCREWWNISYIRCYIQQSSRGLSLFLKKVCLWNLQNKGHWHQQKDYNLMKRKYYCFHWSKALQFHVIIAVRHVIQREWLIYSRRLCSIMNCYLLLQKEFFKHSNLIYRAL